MYGPTEFQRTCNRICERLARNENDRRAFELLHSPDFTFTCAFMGLDPEDVFDHISRIAARRRAAS